MGELQVRHDVEYSIALIINLNLFLVTRSGRTASGHYSETQCGDGSRKERILLVKTVCC